MKQLTDNDIRDIVDMVCDECGEPDLAQQIWWEWNNRLTRTIARASYTKKRIQFSRKVFPLYAKEENRQYKIVVHETCHLVAYYKFGIRIKPHGYEWQCLMRKCGVAPERCQPELPEARKFDRKQIRYKAYCECKTHFITGRVRANILRGVNRVCLSCGSRLKTTNIAEAATC